jgi:hypothetical protein
MIKKITVSIHVLEELLKLPKNVHIGAIQHNMLLDCIDINVFDVDNTLPGDGIYTYGVFDKDKGWTTTPVKGSTRGDLMSGASELFKELMKNTPKDENNIPTGWTYTERELNCIKENAGELYQLAQMLAWNACEIPDRPNEKAVFKDQLAELENLLHRIACGND